MWWISWDLNVNLELKDEIRDNLVYNNEKE